MRILCLANSFKEGGRCLAGIQLDPHNHPVLHSNRPVWIRPVSDTEHGQVPNELCIGISALDVLEFDEAVVNGTGYQSENTTFNDQSIKVLDRLTKEDLNELCDNSRLNTIFGNRGKAISEEAIQHINYSLMLLKISDFQIINKTYEDRERPQVRLTFRYNGNLYDLPVTDSVFLYMHKRNANILERVSEIFVVLSLSVPFENWYYKLVAAIIF